MPDHKHRHKCVRCKRSRSSTFHRQFPAGPGYPTVNGVCRRCRGTNEVPRVHIHHHHWYILEEPVNKQTLEPAEALHSSLGKEESFWRGSQYRHPEQSELPASPQCPPSRRAELGDGLGPRPQELVAGRDAVRSPPPPPIRPKSRCYAYRSHSNKVES
jgi:hypothetical protein